VAITFFPEIVAAGVLPQGLTAGQRAPNVVGAVATKGGGNPGNWQIAVSDPAIQQGSCALILSPGSGSNTASGIVFGQSAQAGSVFTFDAYRNDTGVAIDVEVQFVVVRWPVPPLGGLV